MTLSLCHIHVKITLYTHNNVPPTIAVIYLTKSYITKHTKKHNIGFVKAYTIMICKYLIIWQDHLAGRSNPLNATNRCPIKKIEELTTIITIQTLHIHNFVTVWL